MKRSDFIPDRIFKDIYEITPEFLLAENIRFLLSDIDNTLAKYSEAEPSKKVLVWFERLTERGIKIAFISNNKKKRVETFNRTLGYATLSNSYKPSRKAVFRIMKILGAEKENTCLVGDQIFTDVLCAKRAGIKAFYVDSIEPPKDVFGKLKKKYEKIFIKEYHNKK